MLVAIVHPTDHRTLDEIIAGPRVFVYRTIAAGDLDWFWKRPHLVGRWYDRRVAVVLNFESPVDALEFERRVMTLSGRVH